MYKSSYFPDDPIYFSYKSCNQYFAGNTWVGKCECTGNDGASDGTVYGGFIGGYKLGFEEIRGCKAWDGAEPYCQAGGSSAGSDWCEDAWCAPLPAQRLCRCAPQSLLQ